MQASWYDRKTGKTSYEDFETGLDGATNRLRSVFSSKEEAEQAAKADGERLSRATGSGSLTLAGMPEVMADAPITTAGFRPEANGEWRVASVEHRFAESYTTTISLEAPKEGKK